MLSPRRPPTKREAASRRIAQLGRIAAIQRADGSELDFAVWAWVVAHSYAAGGPARYCSATLPVEVEDGWPGLTPRSLRTKLVEMGFQPTDAQIRRIVRETPVGCPPISASHLGEAIKLNSHQRSRARAHSIEAFDSTKRQRRAETKARRMAADAAAKEAKRRANGVMLRHEYIAKVKGEPNRKAANQRRYRARALSGVSACFEHAALPGVSAHSVQTVTGFVGAPITSTSNPLADRVPEAFQNTVFGRENSCLFREEKGVASGSRLQRSGPSAGASVGAGSGVADRIAGSPFCKAESTGNSKGLPAESMPKSGASEKKTAQLGRTSPEEPTPLIERSAEPSRADNIRAGSTAVLSPPTTASSEPVQVEAPRALAHAHASVPDLFGAGAPMAPGAGSLLSKATTGNPRRTRSRKPADDQLAFGFAAAGESGRAEAAMSRPRRSSGVIANWVPAGVGPQI